VETRELRYFVAVAEELHFGRAAARLGMAQPPLSRAIAGVERRLGTLLLERDRRSVTLTPAGSVLLREARLALAAVEAAERRTLRAAARSEGIVLVTKAGASAAILADLLAAYAAELGAVPVEVVLSAVGQQETLLREGRADVALLHRPYDSTLGLDTEDLHSEGCVLAVPAGHRLARRRRLRLEEVQTLTDPPLPRWPRADGTHADGPGPAVHEHGQLLQLIALGRACALLPESVREELGEDVVAVPVPDAPPVTTVIAWPPHSRSRAVAHLVRVAAAGDRRPSRR
jgi:DNA-binding transcriptional LysR family regulator